MADLYTGGATVSGTIAEFAAYNEILVEDGDSDSPVSLELTDSGTLNLTNQLDRRAVTLSAFSGDDHITTTTGDDMLMGNDGADTLVAGGGNDTLIGGTGDDSLLGGQGDDIFVMADAMIGHDSLFGGAGLDELRLDSGAPLALDWLVVTAAAAVEVLNLNGTTLGGTLGGDLFDLSGMTSTLGGSGIDMDAGNDTFRGMIGDDQITGGAGDDNLSGNAGNDWISGGTGNDTLNGGVGDDTLGLGSLDAAGFDSLQGGLGVDTLVLEAGTVSLGRLVLNAAASVEVLSAADALVLTGDGHDFWDLSGVTTRAQALMIDMGLGQDSLLGSALADQAQGGEGNDSLTGNAGDDALTGGNGNDALAGGLGNDTLTGEAGNDRLDGGDGADSLTGGAGDDAYVIGAGDSIDEDLNGGRDSVTLQGLASYKLGANLENLSATGAVGARLKGNGLDNLMSGGAGNDQINGGLGADTLMGGAGDDIYTVERVADQVIEAAGGGIDTLRTGLAAYTLANGIEVLSGTSATGQALTGNSLDNTLRGLRGADTLDGGRGRDVMQGGDGADTYVVDKSGDQVVEGAGKGRDTVLTDLSAYVLAGNVETLTGTREGRQSLTGNALANTITGGSGADTLSGMGGKDILTGGAGADSFDFRFAPGGGQVDRITDFDSTDRIRLENTGAGLFNALANGALAAEDFRLIGPGGSGALDASDRILYNATTGALYYDADGAGAAARVQFAFVTPATPLSATDFLVI